ncbi:histone-lysine N-methyltransferase SETMAR [Trichonephila clavipes]|nr:histone-lysine N-methyltransferase SETMAR [Trichonephila clavipes]
MAVVSISPEVSIKQFQIYACCQGNFDVKDALRTGWPVVKNVDEITKTIEVGRYVSSRSIVQELKINHKTVLNHLRKVGLKKKLDVWVPQHNPTTPKKHNGSNFHLRSLGQTQMKSTNFLRGW